MTTVVDAPGSRVTTDEERGKIFALARRFVATRAVDTDVGRNAGLLRAAQLSLHDATAAAAFVAAHRDAFCHACKEVSAREAVCDRCGAPMHEASVHDVELGEWMPAWKCGRCGAQVSR
jgi:hypothetical protein